jgi:F0F1-type ATP synthase epsilon subunit
MEIFNSAHDLRVVVVTPSSQIIDTHVEQLEVEDQFGRFIVTAADGPTMAGLVPSRMVLRRRDGSEIHVKLSYGSLTAVGRQARVVLRDASVQYVEPLQIAV